MEDAQPGNYEIVPEDSEEHAHMDPETGEFVAPPRKVISEYDRYGRNIGDRVEHMLEKVFINCQLPTESDIEYMSNACGLSAQAIRGWCKLPQPICWVRCTKHCIFRGCERGQLFERQEALENGRLIVGVTALPCLGQDVVLVQ